MKKYIFKLFIFIFWTGFLVAQPKKNNFRSPLNIPLELAANFGEIRPDHFHMGVDFKTNGKEGLQIFAIENGFVSRVKISPDGYGKSIYIDHPNGITSVYAHCSILKGKIDSLVKVIQTQQENFEVDIYFRAEDLPIMRGQLIALSGNTGHSFAPHLHFELRDTETEDALNPLSYGFDLADHRAPTINAMKVYALSKEGYLLPGKSKIIAVQKNGKNYAVANNLVSLPADYCSLEGGVGFAFETSDQLDGASNNCGIYQSKIYVEGKEFFSQRMDRISFDHTRYVNDHVDYRAYADKDQEFQKSFRTKHNPLGIYPPEKSGILKVKPGDRNSITFLVNDVKGNSSTLSFDLKIEKGTINSALQPFDSKNFFLPDSGYEFQNENMAIAADKFTFYQPLRHSILITNSISLGDAREPVQLPLKVRMKIPENAIRNTYYFIASTNSRGKESSIDAMTNAGWINGEKKSMGKYNLRIDSIPPSVSPRNFSIANCKGKNQFSWSVRESQTELFDYDIYIDGTWYVLEFERKGNYLIFNKPANIKGKHTVQLTVTDSCGNKTDWKEVLDF